MTNPHLDIEYRFHRIENIADSVGDVVVAWERAKAVKATKPASASPGSRTMVFSGQDKLTGVVQMIKEGKERYQEKEYKISLRQNNAKGKVLGYVYVDFAKFVATRSTKTQLVDLTLSNDAVILVLFTSKFKGRAKSKTVQPEQHVPPPEDDLQGLVDDDEVWNQEDDFEKEIGEKKKLNIDKDEKLDATASVVNQVQESANTPQPDTVQVTVADAVEPKLEGESPSAKPTGPKRKTVARAQSARAVQRVNHTGRTVQRAPSAKIERSVSSQRASAPKDETEAGTAAATTATTTEQPAPKKLVRADSGKLVRMPSGKIVRVRRAPSSKSIRPARSGSARKNQLRNDATVSSDNLAVPVAVPATAKAATPAPASAPEPSAEPIPKTKNSPLPGKPQPKKKTLVKGNKKLLSRNPAHSGHLSMDIPILPFESGDFHNIPTFNGIDDDKELSKKIQSREVSSASLPRVPAAASASAVLPGSAQDRRRSVSRSRLQRGSGSSGAGPSSAGRVLSNSNIARASSVTDTGDDSRKFGMGKRTQSERGRSDTGAEWLRKRNSTLRAENEELKALVRELQMWKQAATGAKTGELLQMNESLQAEVDELKLKLTREPIYNDVLLGT